MRESDYNQGIPPEVKQEVLQKCRIAVQNGEIQNVYQEYEFQRRCYKDAGYEWKSPIELDEGLLVD